MEMNDNDSRIWMEEDNACVILARLSLPLIFRYNLELSPCYRLGSDPFLFCRFLKCAFALVPIFSIIVIVFAFPLWAFSYLRACEV